MRVWRTRLARRDARAWIWAVLAIPLPGAFLIPLFVLLRERALLRAQGFAAFS